MTPDTEDLLWRRFNEWFRARRPDYPSEWDAYQAGHADGVADERERCASVCDRCASALDYSGNAYVRSRECQQAADAIRAGAKEPSDG